MVGEKLVQVNRNAFSGGAKPYAAGFEMPLYEYSQKENKHVRDGSQYMDVWLEQQLRQVHMQELAQSWVRWNSSSNIIPPEAKTFLHQEVGSHTLLNAAPKLPVVYCQMTAPISLLLFGK